MNLPFEGYLRRKNAYEAADCGLLLWRRNFAYFLIFFVIPFLIFAIALRLLPGRLQYLSWVILWWLKPLFDRSILHIVSINFFDNNANIKRLRKGLGKTLLRGLFGDLLWRRFSPLRSAAMPLRVLELHKKIKNYNERKKLLNKGGLSYCFLISLWGVSLEIALLAGEFLFIMFMGQLIGKNFHFYGNDFIINIEIYIYALWCLDYILVETIYVCKGFSLYINSRIEVEGWDIEILFRGFTSKKRHIPSNKSIGVLIVLCFLFTFMSANIYAQENNNASINNASINDAIINDASINDVPLEALEEILASADFGGEKDSWKIAPKKEQERKQRIHIFNPWSRLDSLLQRLEHFFASGLRIALVVLGVIFAVTLFIFARRFIKKQKAVLQKPSLTIQQEITRNDPREILQNAQYLFEQGNLRLAWGYCTATAILSWQMCNGMVFPPNATESECAKIVNSQTNTEEAKDFCTLINHWVNFAYAGRVPPQGCFEESIVFCRALMEKANG